MGRHLSGFIEGKKMNFVVLILSISVAISPLVQVKANGYAYANQAQEIIWEMSGCSNINPMVDRNTIIQATSTTNVNKHCSAIRRDLKISDGFGYCISGLRTLVVSGTPFCSNGRPGGNVGIIFNLFDSDNYYFVQKDLCSGTMCWGQKTNGVIGSCTTFGTVSTFVNNNDWMFWRLCVRRSNGQVTVSTSGGGYNTFSGSFTVPTNEIRGQGGTLIVDGSSTTAQFWGYNVVPYL